MNVVTEFHMGVLAVMLVGFAGAAVVVMWCRVADSEQDWRWATAATAAWLFAVVSLMRWMYLFTLTNRALT